MKLFASVLSLVCASSVFAGDSQSSAEASFAFAKAKLSLSNRHLSYSEGIERSKRTGKPLLIVVNLDCDSLCRQVRDSVLIVREKSLFGSSQSRVILAIPVGNDLMRVAEWGGLPKQEEVLRELNKHSPRGMIDLFDMTAALAINQFFDCPDGRCPAPQIQEPSRMPIGDGPVFAYPPPVVLDAPRRPVLFPRLFALRQRIRLGLGLRRVQVVTPVQSQEIDEANVMASGRFNGRIVQQILLRRGVPLDKIAALQKKYSEDSPVWWLLLRALIEYGLPKLLDLIEELLK